MNLNSKYYFDNYGYRVGDTRCRSGKCCNLISVGCIQWDFPSTELYNKKETLEEILIEIEEKLKLLSGTFPMVSIGDGVPIYGGVADNKNIFYSLTSSGGIILTPNETAVDISLDPDALPPSGVTSVGLQAPLGFSIINSPVTSVGDLIFDWDSGYTPYTTAEQTKLLGIEAGAQVNVQSDWNAISGVAQILNKPTLATVATTGDYNDLINLPTLTTGTVTSVALTTPTGLQVTGSPITTSGTLALAFQIGYSIPTNTSQSNWNTAYGWGNHADEGYLTTETDPTVPSWAKQPNKPTYGWAEITGKPTFHAVATSGNYNDLINKPTFTDTNIGNTNLTLSAPRILNTNSYDFSITSLPNKSTDATFNEFLGKNSSGVLARIGYPAFKAQAESWTQAQRNEFSQILNGGFSVGTMSVNLISPPVFERENNDLYIVLRGANLNLHPTDRKIEILNATTNAVLAEVPTGQIQTYVTGTELIFYYNFYSLGVGTYKLKITNGVNTFITTQNFQIVSSVNNIDLLGNTFDIVTSYTNTLSSSTNNTVFFENEIQGVNSASPIFSAKSDELFEQGENWYLEVLINFSVSPYGSTSANAASLSTIGVGYSNTTNSLAYSTLNGMKLHIHQTSATQVGKRVGNLAAFVNVLHPYSSSVIFIKQGNLLTCVSDTQIYSTTISNNSGYSLFLQIPNRVGKEVYSAQIIKAYTF